MKYFRIDGIALGTSVRVDKNVEISIRNSGSFSLGAYSSLNGPGSRYLSVFDGISIGNYTSIGPDCLILDYNHDLDFPSTWRFRKHLGLGEFADYRSNGRVRIGSNVWIGAKSIVLPGSNIPDNVVVAAGSVVSGSLESCYLYGGVPAKKIKPIYTDFAVGLKRIDWNKKPKDVFTELSNRDL